MPLDCNDATTLRVAPVKELDPKLRNEFCLQVSASQVRDACGPHDGSEHTRVIGSIRGECLDHVMVFHESSLRRILTPYFEYYHRSRTHLSLGKDSPEPRSTQPQEMGRVVAIPQVGGLHHRYEGRAA